MHVVATAARTIFATCAGTSACANGKFWCMNKGYKGRFVRSGFVNDYVCDCCDGSDEHSSGIACPNTCEAAGAAARQKAADQLRVVSAGYGVARQWSEKAIASKQTWEVEVEKVKQELVAKREEAAKVEEEKKAAEEIEERCAATWLPTFHTPSHQPPSLTTAGRADWKALRFPGWA